MDHVVGQTLEHEAGGPGAVAAPRVASLLPCATEMVALLGAVDLLVGVSHECDYPAGLERLPRLTRTRVRHPASGVAIDAEVRALLEQALAVFEVDAAGLAAARPDIVLTQDLCDVCAVSKEAVERAAREVLGGDARIVCMSPSRLAEVWQAVRAVGVAIGRPERGEREAARLEERCRALAMRARAALAGASAPRVLTIEWLAPVMVGGTWMPDLVELAGGVAVAATAGAHAPTLSEAELARLEVDCVLVKPCGFTLEHALADLEAVERLVQAVRIDPRRVWIADGNAYFNRPGPRLVESLEILLAILHEGACDDLRAKHARDVVDLPTARALARNRPCTP